MGFDNDNICKSCKKPDKNNVCTDILPPREIPVFKQEYNDELNRKIPDHLKTKNRTIIRLYDYFKMISDNLDNIISISIYPKEDFEYRSNDIVINLKKLA